jgi:hypothetical protein
LVAFLILASPGTACAGPVILNFDALRQDDADLHVIPPVYQSQGFTLTARSTPFNPPNFAYLGVRSAFSPGVPALFHHISPGGDYPDALG